MAFPLQLHMTVNKLVRLRPFAHECVDVQLAPQSVLVDYTYSDWHGNGLPAGMNRQLQKAAW